MDNGEISDQAVHCLDIFGTLHRAPPFSPKKSLATVVSEVIPSKSSGASPSSPKRSSLDSAVQPKAASPFLNRSLRRALLTSPARNVAVGGRPLNSTDSEVLQPIDNGGPQFESSRSTRASTLDYMTQIFPGRR